jgi:hypothetical protein
MASKFFERRAVRNQLKTYLDGKGWVDLVWAEGFSDSILDTVVPPFIVVSLDDLGREELQMGSSGTDEKLLSRRAQIDVYMESEDRVSAITDDISDFFDLEVIIIKDNSSTVLGSLVSDTNSIMGDISPPDLSEEHNLEWRGIVGCSYEAFYPNG